ncbi:unnamed protein product [Hydatigera taeniaeformis]|uniref:RGS domain-containing protein n=1 Tax=Hydatigena taeniaeformis TaxID=6205 RepID=A0A0R3XB31_HYDTA|nr:unnamed protein product [Hydatigera taeniaeformis]
MASTVSTPHRSSLSLAYSLNHSRGDLKGERKVKAPRLRDWNRPTRTISVSTIPPIDSGAWQRLTRFQRRFYEWLVFISIQNLKTVEEFWVLKMCEGPQTSGNVDQVLIRKLILDSTGIVSNNVPRLYLSYFLDNVAKLS